jgi:predicted O-methyltransferase YrrM
VDIPVPSLVREATARARREGFSLSCDPAAGRLLAVLAAHLPAGARAGRFNLIFADAQGGKWEGLDRTIAALAPHGMLIVDDMTATPQWDTEQHASQQQVRQVLLTSPLLTSVELRDGSGVILSIRHA